MYLSVFRFAPIFLIVLTVLIQPHVYLYFAGYLVTVISTYLLKGFFKEPRPLLDNTIRYGYDYYGCPSGHASSVWYSSMFVLLVLRNYALFAFYALISCVTMYQRVVYHHHTVRQVLVGAILGCSIAISNFLWWWWWW